jgi:hypothetical protein
MTEATGGELLTLWKVGRVELPKIAQVYLDAIDALTAARGAAAACFQPSADGPPESTAGEAGPAWQRVCDELIEILSLCARNTLDGADAVGRAIAERTHTDADGAASPTEPGQELWRRIHDPNEIDPADPDQNPPRPPAAAVPAEGQPPSGEDRSQPAAESSYLAKVTRAAESIRRQAIDKQKADEEAFEAFIKTRYQQYADDVTASWKEWERAYTEYRTQRHDHETATASGPSQRPSQRPPQRPSQRPPQSAPQRPPSAQSSAVIAEARAEYEKQLQESYAWIVPAFQAWAAHDPDALTPGIAAIKAAEDRLGDGQAVRFASSAQINLASQWDGSYCTNLRNFLASFLIMPGNQQIVARTLRELLEAEQALYRQAQGNMLQLAEKAEEAIKACGTENRPETRTFLTILSAVAWIAGAALAIPSGGASIYAGVVSFNAVAAVSGAAASLLPGGDPKSIGADKVDDVVGNVSQVMAEARGQLAARERDIVAALEHNHQALVAVRQRSADSGTAGPVTPSQPTIIGAEAGQIAAHLHPK